jgi:tRNA 2-thiouridine synthesizing protein A
LRIVAKTPYASSHHTRHAAMADIIFLDLTGLKCPLPALRTAKALKALAAGQSMVVRCTDPMAAIDIPNLLRETGDELRADEREDEHLVFTIRKAGHSTG